MIDSIEQKNINVNIYNDNNLLLAFVTLEIELDKEITPYNASAFYRSVGGNNTRRIELYLTFIWATTA